MLEEVLEITSFNSQIRTNKEFQRELIIPASLLPASSTAG